MKRWSIAGLLLAFCVLRSQAQIVPRHVELSKLNINTRELYQRSMELCDQLYDPAAKLMQNQGYKKLGPGGGYHLVRDSSWYALGLLLRDGPGDRQRAADVIDAVLKTQYLVPGVRWYGTYKRAPEEPTPDSSAVIWHAYDPNWRVFIGTTWQIILIEYADRIPATLAERMYKAIDISIDGEIAEGRLVPSYTNIALMYGSMWDFAAVHDKRADWLKKSAEWNETVYSLYKKYHTFNEYNSPTYCGVDLYGLGLWRDYGTTEHMRNIGSEMEAGLWRDIAEYYQPALRNISGPYDRAYGMDMESYVAVDGVWMRSVMDEKIAPLPINPTFTTDHVGDLYFAPQIAILGTRIPADAMSKMLKFSGPHLVRKQITDQRVATAWIGSDVVFGGEATDKTKDISGTSQFHPVTIQWRTPSGEIGWVQLTKTPMIDATADPHGITISASGLVGFRIHAKGMAKDDIVAGDWKMPGLDVKVSSDVKSFSVMKATGAADDSLDVVYPDITGMRLEIKTIH